jgi:hypothetical protein
MANPTWNPITGTGNANGCLMTLTVLAALVAGTTWILTPHRQEQ